MNLIHRKICYLAESLLVKGELLNWRRFNLSPLSIADIVEIAPVCNKQTDRIVVGAQGSCRDNALLFIALDNHGYGMPIAG